MTYLHISTLYIYIYTLHILVNVDHLATNHAPFSGSSQDHPGKRPGPRLGVECHESLWCAGGSSSLRSSVILGLRSVSPSQSPDWKPCHGFMDCHGVSWIMSRIYSFVNLLYNFAVVKPFLSNFRSLLLAEILEGFNKGNTYVLLINLRKVPLHIQKYYWKEIIPTRSIDPGLNRISSANMSCFVCPTTIWVSQNRVLPSRELPCIGNKLHLRFFYS